MEVYLNELNGLASAVIALRESKRHMDREYEMGIRNVFNRCIKHDYGMETIDVLLNRRAVLAHKRDKEYLMPHVTVETTSCNGALIKNNPQTDEWLEPVFRIGNEHITLLKFIDLEFTVYGLHRAGQDDLDSHAKRMDNRIIRASTRLGRFEGGEMSDWYKGKILTTDQALAVLGITIPDELVVEDKVFVKAPNGYCLKGMENANDVRRGLYMLSIPSDFIFKINLAEFAHVFQQRWEGGAAHPELKEAVMDMAHQVMVALNGHVNNQYLLQVKN